MILVKSWRKDSVFYKIGYFSSFNNTKTYIAGTAQRCIFADCAITSHYSYFFRAEDCVFLGNTIFDQTKPDATENSSIQITQGSIFEQLLDGHFICYYREDTGTTYVRSLSTTSPKAAELLAKAITEELGGNFAKFETKEEAEWLYENNRSDFYDRRIYMGIRAGENGEFLWYDGTAVDTALLENPFAKATDMNIWRNGKIIETETSFGETLFEIPGKI